MGKVLIMLLLALGVGLYFSCPHEVILGYAEPLLTPVRRWTTSQEPSRFDVWGSRYTLRVQGKSFYISSAGWDGELGTTDDLIESRRLAPRARSR